MHLLLFIKYVFTVWSPLKTWGGASLLGLAVMVVNASVPKPCVSILMFQVAHFKDYIPLAFPGGHSMILDAEVLLIDTKTSKPLPFGTLGVHKVRTPEPICTFFGSLLSHFTLSSPLRKPPFKTPKCAFLFSTVSTSMAWVSWRGNVFSLHSLSE